MSAAGSDRRAGQRAGLAGRIWRCIFRGPVVPRTDRERKWVVFNTLVLHLRPVCVPEATIRYTHTFGLGGMSLVLVLLRIGDSRCGVWSDNASSVNPSEREASNEDQGTTPTGRGYAGPTSLGSRPARLGRLPSRTGRRINPRFCEDQEKMRPLTTAVSHSIREVVIQGKR
jgi:hypothetical protein